MKCRNCDNEAIYEDGLCEECHRRAAEQKDNNPEAKVMSREERNSFRGQTIDEDGNVHDSTEDTTIFDTVFRSRADEEQTGGPHVHVYTSSSGLPFRIKLAAGFILFVVIAIALAALSLLVIIGPYLLGGAIILLVYNVLKSLMRK